MLDITNIENLRFSTERQIFDRKSAKIDAKSLAIHIIAFANADGGDLIIGIEDNGDITGIDGHEAHINELLRAPFDYCILSVNVDTHILDCTDSKGNRTISSSCMCVPVCSSMRTRQMKYSTASAISLKK